MFLNQIKLSMCGILYNQAHHKTKLKTTTRSISPLPFGINPCLKVPKLCEDAVSKVEVEDSEEKFVNITNEPTGLCLALAYIRVGLCPVGQVC